MGYTDEQREAIYCVDKDLVVTAGAGAGKTRVMVDRIIHILRQGLATIDQLVAITYTNKAALEITERLRSEIIKNPDEKMLRKAGEKLGIAYIGTIHSFCLRLLKENPVEAGIDPQIQVLEESRAEALLKQSIKEAIINNLDLDNVYKLTAEIGYEKLVNEIFDVMIKMRNQGFLASDFNLTSCTEDEKTVIMLIQKSEEIFEGKKVDLGAIDFEDILQKTCRMLQEHADLLCYYHKKLKYIMVDEYQDLNFLQDKIIRMLGQGTNLFVVGDKKQSIYGFRGSRVELFEKLLEDLKAKGSVVNLKHNFRSCSPIIDFVNEHFQNLIPEYEPIIPMRTSTETLPNITFLMTPAEGNMKQRRRLEGEMIASKILELMADQNFVIYDKENGKSRRPAFKDFVVLLRKKTHLKSYEEAFKKYGVPYIVADTGSLVDSPRVKKLLCVFKTIKDGDLINLYGTLNGVFKIDDEQIARFALDEGQLPIPNETSHDFSQLYRDISDAYQKIMRWKEMDKRLTLHELALRIVRETNLAEMAEDDDIEDIQNVIKFLELLREYDKAGYGLGEFLDELEDFGEDYQEANLNQTQDAVGFVTIHSSKGLEFPIVILADAASDIDAKTRELLYEPEAGLALKKNENRWNDIKEILKQKELEESKRLLYVALTRAEDFLIISGEAKSLKKESFQKWIFSEDISATDAKYELITALPCKTVSSLDHIHITSICKYSGKGGFRKQKISNGLVFSVTVLGEYLRCPRRFFLSQIAKIPENIFFENTSTQKLSASQRGKIVHGFLEQYAGCKFGEKEIQHYARFLLQKGIGDEDVIFITSCLENYLKMKLDDLPGDVYSELPFIYRLNDELALSGIIDRAVIHRSGTVIDFKTNAHISEALLKSYEFQVRVYAEAISRIMGVAVERAVLASLQEGKVYEIDVSRQSLDSCKKMLCEVTESIQSSGYSIENFKRTLNCQQCGYKSKICK